MIFNSPTIGKLSLKRVIKELLCFINQEPNRNYKIIIGTDSSGRGEKPDFVTALVVHRVGRGGRYFWKRVGNGFKPFPTLRQRIYKEVALSLELAQKLLKNFEPDKLRQDLEIHVDVGRNGETRDMIKEVVGMVRGSGLRYKIKPESYAASTVADKHV